MKEKSRLRFPRELIAYLLIVGVGIYGFWANEQDNKNLVHSQECTEAFLNETGSVLENRTGFNSVVQKADREQNLAWSRYVAFSLEHAMDSPEQAKKNLPLQIKMVQSYFNKIERYLDAIDKAELNRTGDPYPDRTRYRKCLENE